MCFITTEMVTAPVNLQLCIRKDVTNNQCHIFRFIYRKSNIAKKQHELYKRSVSEYIYLEWLLSKLLTMFCECKAINITNIS